MITICGNIALIRLTKGRIAVIDAADVGLVRGLNWCAAEYGQIVYAVSSVKIDGGKRRTVYMHRLILGLVDRRIHADHIDGDGLNNRRENLRACSNAENRRNSRTPRHNTSGFKGVCWNSDSGKWQAGIKINGRQKHLGLFETAAAAHAAYCAAASQLHGKFARTA